MMNFVFKMMNFDRLFDASKFAKMKPTSVFVNVGRGATTKLDDLDAALRAGTVGGAAIDVFEVEPLPEDHPVTAQTLATATFSLRGISHRLLLQIWDAPNFIMTPHVAIQGNPDKTTMGHVQVVVRSLQHDDFL